MKRFFQVALLSLISINVQAKKFTCSNTLKVGDVEVDKELVIGSPDYAAISVDPNWRNTYSYHKIENRLILSVNAKHENYQPQGYQADVQVEIIRTLEDGNTFKDKKDTVILSVTYSTSGEYKGIAAMTFEGGHVFKARVLKVTPAVGSKVMNLELTAETHFERYKKLNPLDVVALSHDGQYEATRNELEVTWPTVFGAEEYDLEWTYVNNVAPNGTFLPEDQIEINDDIFRSNNTRITLSDVSEHGGNQLSYRIPLIYEQGYILYRVRAVGVDINEPSQIIAAKWSSDDVAFTKVSEFKNASDNQNNYYFISTGHQERINWQSSVTFIEEGKNKVAVSYADGTLRSRQQVSRLNQEDETVVGETVYDHQGRKAIDIIPAPTGNKKIEFTPNFNVDATDNKPYSRKHFDIDKDDECNLEARPLSDLSGAGKYYSKENELKFQHDVAIPDADGYPFIQTVYTNDNTGRIRSQGGIGADHQIGTTHETKNFYGKPLQVEIDRMFGSEAGFASHYQKNLVQDPNGQVTVSYMDLAGNVVATSLAGTDPHNLVQLESNVSQDIREDLLEEELNAEGKPVSKQTISSDGMSKIYNHEVLVSEDGTYRAFDYEVDPAKLEINLNCGPGEVATKYCFDCVLNVELMVINKCGKEMLVKGLLEGAVVNEELLTQAIDENQVIALDQCDRIIHPFTYQDIASSLLVGDYTVRKVLTINQDVLEHYTEQFLATACLKSKQDFIDENEAEIDDTGCASDCQLCIDNLGDYDQYDINANPDCAPCLSYDEYQSRVKVCEELCTNEPTNCSSKLELMKMDVSPYGQYGEIQGGGQPFNSESFKLSVYNTGNELPANTSVSSGPATDDQLKNGSAHWQNPVHFETGEEGYFNANGLRAKVEVIFNGTSFEPAVIGSVSTAGLEEGDIVEVYPKELANVTDFLAEWPADNSWANSLVKYHPEYNGYVYCLTNMKSHKFDRAMQTSTSIEDFIVRYNLAFGKSLSTTGSDEDALNPIGSMESNGLDPYFNSSESTNLITYEYKVMKYIMNNYKVVNGTAYDMLKFAYVTKNCPQALVEGCADCSNELTALLPNDVPDDVWMVFKSMYLAEKQKLYDIRLNIESLSNDFYCGCIGNEKWSFYQDGFLGAGLDKTTEAYHVEDGGSYGGTLSQLYAVGQPCAWFRYDLFKDKEPIFPKYKSQVPESFNSGIDCYIDGADPSVSIPGLPSRLISDPNCNDRDQALVNAMQNNAIKTYMETCGECPVTYDFETLMSQLVGETNQLKDNEVVFGCYPTGKEGWTDLLNTSAGFSGGTVSYLGSENASRMLTGTFTDVGGTATMVVKIQLEASYTIEDYSTGSDVLFIPQFTDIKNICCVALNESPTGLIPVGSESPFTAYITVPFTQPGDNEVRDVRLKVEGVVDGLDFENCSFSTCNQTQVGADLGAFFGMLAYYDVTGGVQSAGHFTSTDPVYFSADETENPTDFLMISDLLKTSGPAGSSNNVVRWEWKQTEINTAGHYMTASLKTYTGSTGSYTEVGSMAFTFTAVVNTDFPDINFTDVFKIRSIQPNNSTGSDQEYDFVLMVDLYNSISEEYTTRELHVTQNLKTFKTGECIDYSKSSNPN